MLSIFCMSRRRGTVLKALLMSIVASIVRCGGLGRFWPSSVVCVRCVRSVLVECLGRKPCCVWDRGMCGVMFCRTSLSSILEGVQRREIGL